MCTGRLLLSLRNAIGNVLKTTYLQSLNVTDKFRQFGMILKWKLQYTLKGYEVLLKHQR